MFVVLHFLFPLFLCLSEFRSFSELYHKAIQDAESKSGEGQSGEAWVLDDDEEVEVDGNRGEKEEKKQIENKTTDRETPKQMIHEEQKRSPEPMETDSLLSPPSLPLLRATSLQDSMKSQSPEVSLTRSYSLEGHPPYQDIIEEYTDFCLPTSHFTQKLCTP